MKIVNTTVYDSQDVADFLLKVYPNLNSLKIRYLNAPTWSDSFVSLRPPSRSAIVVSLEVAIIRLSKLQQSPLMMLACATSEEATAPAIVVEHLMSAIRHQLGRSAMCQYFRGLPGPDAIDKLQPPIIRVYDKAKDRKAATIASLREKIETCQASILNRESKIEHAKRVISHESERLEHARAALVDYERKLASHLVNKK